MTQNWVKIWTWRDVDKDGDGLNADKELGHNSQPEEEKKQL